MSDSLMAFQPAIDEPSNIRPSSSSSSPSTEETMVRCCHLPLGSVKRRSTHSISSSLIRLTISDAVGMAFLPLTLDGCCCGAAGEGPVRRNSDGGLVPLPGADAQDGVHGADEDLAVTDTAGLGSGA